MRKKRSTRPAGPVYIFVRPMQLLGPNTNAPADLLSRRCIVIAGEDRRHVQALHGASAGSSHAFRGYEFWKQPELTLILSGIGTGCIEPLLWEITRPRILEEIVLLGTAGKMPAATVRIGQPYAIAAAFLAATALDGEGLHQPLRPRWQLPKDLSVASCVSTDLFYGFGPATEAQAHRLGSTARQLYDKHIEMGTQLVDMEVGQFYAFCDCFGNPSLRYVAVKGASNEIGAHGQQIAESAEVIRRCFELAVELMGI